jgi:hypothetical protein
MKADERHTVLRKQRYNVARELGATWQRAQKASQGGECFLAFLAEVGIPPEPYMHLYTRPHRVIGPMKPKQHERSVRYAVLKERGYSAMDAQEFCQGPRAFEQAMEITDP